MAFTRTFHIIVFAFSFLQILVHGKEMNSTEIPRDEFRSGNVNARVSENSEEQLKEFYRVYSKNNMPWHYRKKIETMLNIQDDIDRKRYRSARSKIRSIFIRYPRSDFIWEEDATTTNANVGDPIAYYGMRMLEQIAFEKKFTVSGQLQMTAVVAKCAKVRRPLKDGGSETLNLKIKPELLANNARVLHQATSLFRRWVKSITRGLEVKLVVYRQSRCANVDYVRGPEEIDILPDSEKMIDAVPKRVSSKTDFWWVIAPSGVPGDGTGFDHIITGGMGSYGYDLPLFVSDDQWFLRKPEHLGKGPYTDVERRLYQPQWFQHELMHHLYEKWSDFGLEETDHSWFDRANWPSDFKGEYEADYYFESIKKRLLNASPSLAAGLKAPVLEAELSRSELLGSYERIPVENTYHEVTIKQRDGRLYWKNAANVEWRLIFRNGKLKTGSESPYGEQDILFKLSHDGSLNALVFNEEDYVRIK